MRALGGHTGRGGRPCGVCTHPKRKAIEDALVTMGTLRGVERVIDGCPDRACLRRHRDRCIGPMLAAKRDEITEGLAETARERAEQLYGEASDLLEKARALVEHTEAAEGVEPKDRARAMTAAAALLGQVKACVELLARLTGELRSDVSIGVILATPDWRCIEDALEAALLPHPEAAAAVARALRGLEAGPATVLVEGD